MQSRVEESVEKLFVVAWDRGLTSDDMDHVALETAGLCLWRGRDHGCLVIDFTAALRGGQPTAAELLRTLIPDRQRFRVALIVEGASELRGLAKLMDAGAAPSQSALGREYQGWGQRFSKFQAFIDRATTDRIPRKHLSNASGSGLILSFWTTARDRRQARTTEIDLDQSGHPWCRRASPWAGTCP
jgi:hypothetical protein